MTESSVFWTGTVTGDAGPYTDDKFSDTFRVLFQSDRTTQGPLYGLQGQLQVTNPSGLTIRVATGYGIVDGKIYENTASIDFTVAIPVSGNNYYRVVLRKDFTAQTVRAAILGPNNSAPPAVTQTDGTTWEISLATVQVTSGNVVTVTDTRDFCMYNTDISDGWIESDMIAANAIDHTKMVNRTRHVYLPPDYAGISGGTELTRGETAGQFWECQNSSLNYYKAMWIVPIDYYSDLTISAMYKNASLSSQTIRVKLQAWYNPHTDSDPGTIVTAGPSTETIPASTGAYLNEISSWAPAITAGEVIDIYALRDGPHADDTATGTIYFAGFYIEYVADM